MKVAVVTAVLLVLAARPAAACGVPNLGQMLAEVAESLDPQTTPIHTPLLIAGGGTTSDGRMGSVAVGYGWGTRDEAACFRARRSPACSSACDPTGRRATRA